MQIRINFLEYLPIRKCEFIKTNLWQCTYKRVRDSEFMKIICENNLQKETEFLHKLQARADLSYMGIDSTTRSPIFISSDRLEMFTKFRLSVEVKQALNFSGILKLIWLERNNHFSAECFSGVQLGHVQLLNFNPIPHEGGGGRFCPPSDCLLYNFR